MEPNNLKEELVSVFEKACSSHKERLDFICSVRESDTFSNVDVPLAPIKIIIEIAKNEENQTEILKLAIENIKTLSTVGSGQYIASHFSTHNEVAIIFCISYFLYHFNFLHDENKKQLLKRAFEAVAEKIADYLNEN
ncbi:DUF1951 domain-containing protein [Mycoplasmoides pneumoniae]|uniref:DUF1951 domain-containing protein n=1 Tax=Mycoplasmoides pneumoniae TaxID=2104 RepID=UPI0006BA21BC|nr:DUF1951 domain-containing protein [Mycoplasmoides pneumoniae]